MEIISVLNTRHRKTNLISFKSLLIFPIRHHIQTEKYFRWNAHPRQKCVTEMEVAHRMDLEALFPRHPSWRNKFTEMKTRNNWWGPHGLTERQRDASCQQDISLPTLSHSAPTCPPTTQLCLVDFAGWAEPRSLSPTILPDCLLLFPELFSLEPPQMITQLHSQVTFEENLDWTS